MVIARKIAYNVILNSFLKVFSTVVLSLFSVRLITGYLGQDGFGKYSTMLAFFALFAAIADLGLSSVTVREISREGADEKNILNKAIPLRLTSSLAVFLLSPLIIVFFDYARDLKISILIAAGAVVFSTLSLFLNGVFQKRLAMDKVALVELAGKLFQVGLIVLIVKNNLGFLAIAVAFFMALAFNALIVFSLSRRYVKFSPHFDFAYWKIFLGESWPMGATAVITFMYFKMDTIILSVLQPSAHVGIYNVAYKVIENLIFFPAMLAGLILPLLSRYIFTNHEQFREIADKTFKVFLLIIAPLVVGTFFLAPDIIRIISGGDFQESAGVLRVLIFALGFIFFGHFFTMLLVVGNAQKKLMQMLLVAATFNIIINLVLIEKYSYFGAAGASVATEMLVVVLTAFLVRKHIHYSPSFKHTGKIFLSGVMMAAVLIFLKSYPFFIAGTVGVAVYLLFLWLTRSVTSDEVNSLFPRQNTLASIEETEAPLS
jgi:O-antigen/teichoic acid export membrane protein